MHVCCSSPPSSRLNFVYPILTALNNIAFASGELSSKNDVSPVLVSGDRPCLPQGISFVCTGWKQKMPQAHFHALPPASSPRSSLLSTASTSHGLRDRYVTTPSSSMAVCFMCLLCLAPPPAGKEEEHAVSVDLVLLLPPCFLVIRVFLPRQSSQCDSPWSPLQAPVMSLCAHPGAFVVRFSFIA